MANGHFGRILEAKAAMKRILKPGTPAYFIHDTDLARGMGLSELVKLEVMAKPWSLACSGMRSTSER